jgi:hypothetical protein
VADVDRVLADDGILILRTPNLVAERPILFLQRLLGKEQGLFCGPAPYVFNPTTLTLLLQRLGYHDVKLHKLPALLGGSQKGLALSAGDGDESQAPLFGNHKGRNLWFRERCVRAEQSPSSHRTLDLHGCAQGNRARNSLGDATSEHLLADCDKV